MANPAPSDLEAFIKRAKAIQSGEAVVSVDVGPAPVEAEQQEEEEATASKLSSLAFDLQIPAKRSALLKGHLKTVSAISMDHAGVRLISGGFDNEVQLFDFGAIDLSEPRPIFSFEPEEGHTINSLEYSKSGGKFLVCSGSCCPCVYDRDGNLEVKFIQGDQKLFDKNKTRGHSAMVNDGKWHPVEKDLVYTCSNDGTVREWNIQGKKSAFDELLNSKVIKIRDRSSKPVGASALQLSPSGKVIVVAGLDGSLQLLQGKYIRRPKAIWDAHTASSEYPTTCVEFVTETQFLSRGGGGDNSVKLWDIRNFGADGPLKVFDGIANLHQTGNLAISPSGNLFAVGPSIRPRSADPGQLQFYDLLTADPTAKFQFSAVPNGSAVCVHWHRRWNQLAVGGSDGTLRMFYDPELTMEKKGVLISASRVRKRKRDNDFVGMADVVFTPNALPLFADAPSHHNIRKRMRKDPKQSSKPMNVTCGPGKTEHLGWSGHTDHILGAIVKDTYRQEDPRAALLKHAGEKPIWVGPAYASSQPKTVLSEKTLEQEQKELEDEIARRKEEEDGF